jgi:hypothetical protein
MDCLNECFDEMFLAFQLDAFADICLFTHVQELQRCTVNAGRWFRTTLILQMARLKLVAATVATNRRQVARSSSNWPSKSAVLEALRCRTEQRFR